jgi:hypothetical protein
MKSSPEDPAKDIQHDSQYQTDNNGRQDWKNTGQAANLKPQRAGEIFKPGDFARRPYQNSGQDQQPSHDDEQPAEITELHFLPQYIFSDVILWN